MGASCGAGAVFRCQNAEPQTNVNIVKCHQLGRFIDIRPTYRPFVSSRVRDYETFDIDGSPGLLPPN